LERISLAPRKFHAGAPQKKIPRPPGGQRDHPGQLPRALPAGASDGSRPGAFRAAAGINLAERLKKFHSKNAAVPPAFFLPVFLGDNHLFIINQTKGGTS